MPGGNFAPQSEILLGTSRLILGNTLSCEALCVDVGAVLFVHRNRRHGYLFLDLRYARDVPMPAGCLLWVRTGPDADPANRPLLTQGGHAVHGYLLRSSAPPSRPRRHPGWSSTAS